MLQMENTDNDVTACEFTEKNTNKPIQGEVLPTQIKVADKVVPNEIKHAKNTFDEVVSQFVTAIQSSIRVKTGGIPDIIPIDKFDKIKPIDVHNSYFVTTQDINKNHRENSNINSVFASKADDEVMLCSVDGNVKNQEGENENTYCGINLPSQENIDDESASYAMLTNVSDLSDEESTPKKTKRLTFTDSDFPDDDEIRDILMLYPKPAVIESCSDSELDDSSEDEIDELFLRFRNKPELETKIDFNRLIGIENLPDRVMTRLRNLAPMFKPIYLKEQEDQINEDIVLENIKRLKSFKEAKTSKGSKNHESFKQEKKETRPRKKPGIKRNERKRKVKVKIGNPKRKGNKSKSRKNTKEGSSELHSISEIKTTTRITRSVKNENDGSNTQNKHIFPEKKYKKPNHKRKPYKKERTICSKIERRRSKRQQKANEKNDDTMKALISILKKSKPKQSTVYNGPSSSSESPKGLKRSLDDDSDVSTSLKRTRSHNSNNNRTLQNTLLRATPATAVKTQHLHLATFTDKEHKQDKLNPCVYLERYEPAQKRIGTLNINRKFLTQRQHARKTHHRACKRTREAARTSTKRL